MKLQLIGSYILRCKYTISFKSNLGLLIGHSNISFQFFFWASLSAFLVYTDSSDDVSLTKIVFDKSICGITD